MLSNKKGQAVLEMALFGSLILFGFSVLLSYLQNMNNQQYGEMETFRRALEKACTYTGETTDGAGASVQLSLMQNRRNVAVSGGYKKGTPTSVSASSSTYWAIPSAGEQPDNLRIYRINEDESPPLPKGAQIEGTISNTEVSYAETMEKSENPAQIATHRQSELGEVITHTILGEDDQPIWQITQGLYKDADGQYKYSSQASNNQEPVKSERTWKTDF